MGLENRVPARIDVMRLGGTGLSPWEQRAEMPVTTLFHTPLCRTLTSSATSRRPLLAPCRCRLPRGAQRKPGEHGSPLRATPDDEGLLRIRMGYPHPHELGEFPQAR